MKDLVAALAIFGVGLIAIPIYGSNLGGFGAPSEARWPDRTKAPDFIGDDWKNSPEPIHLSSLKGKVILVHFWTLGCINCKHNLGAYNAWQTKLVGPKFEIVGIHTPETDYERSSLHLNEAIQRFKIKYPVLSDNSGTNWNRWHNEFWPEIYLVDKKGVIRDSWSGELEFNDAHGTEKLTKEIMALEGEK